MSARELFENIRSERKEIRELNERVELIRSRADAKTILPQPVIAHTNNISSIVEDTAIESAELQEELTIRIKKLKKNIYTAEKIVSQIKCSEYRRVISAYYLIGDRRVSMKDIARRIPCGEGTAWRYFRKGMKVAEDIFSKTTER